MTPRSMMDALEKLISRKGLVLDEELAVARACAHSPEKCKYWIKEIVNEYVFVIILFSLNYQ